MKSLKDQHSSNPDVSLLVSNLKEWSNQFKNIPFMDGRLIESVSISTGTTEISHGLNRTPVGWFIVTKNANGNVWEVSKSRTKLTLDTSTNLTASIWVF
jgi:hypothetical protein